mmetsp:Transcript_38742/g.99467  ORF Transcript_38742/g.99467 Transcript_38742/m.99467 type:complete len:133 (-) Transcript_38742:805-1203(-)
MSLRKLVQSTGSSLRAVAGTRLLHASAARSVNHAVQKVELSGSVAKEPEKLRGWEFDSANEQDPLNQEGRGANDEAWGEWGLDREIPWFSDKTSLYFLMGGFGFFYLLYKFGKSLDAPERLRPMVGTVWVIV